MSELENGPIPEELPQFEDKTRWFWPVLVGLTLAVLLGLWVARPVYRHIKSWRAGRIVAEGNLLLEAGDLPATSRALVTAFGLSPADPRVLRLATRYCVRAGLPNGLQYFEMLMNSKAATMEDRQEFVRFAQAQARLDLSGQLIQELISAEPKNLTNQLLVLDQLVLLGEWGKVVSGAETMLKEYPDSTYVELILARAYLGTHNSELSAKAAGLLHTLIQTDNPERLPALRTLALMFGPPPEELARVADQLVVNTNIMADRLLAWEVRERIDPPHLKETQERALANLSTNLGETDTVAAAEWFRSQRRRDLVRQLVPETQARKSPSLLLVHCEILADEGQWDALEAILADPKSLLQPTARGCLKALDATGTGHAGLAGGFLVEAVKAAGTSVEQLEIIAHFAEQLRQPEAATAAWTAMLQNPRTTVPAAMMLLRLAKSHDDLSIERLVYQHLLGPLGDQKQVRYQNAYLSLLFNEKANDAAVELAALNQKYPNDVDIYMALALAELRQGHAEKALSLCESANLDWDKQPARWRAVYALVLDANQQREASRQLARRLNLTQLKVPERQLIQPLLAPK